MDEEHAILMNELRYAERLCERMARLYRKAGTFATFITVLGGSAVIGSLSKAFPFWVSIAGVVALAVAGALSVAVRPADKAATAEADRKRYAGLRVPALTMSAAELKAALQRLHDGDSPEIEPLRAVAYNDMVTEIGREDCLIPLTTSQRMLAALA